VTAMRLRPAKGHFIERYGVRMANEKLTGSRPQLPDWVVGPALVYRLALSLVARMHGYGLVSPCWKKDELAN
jgi:hypothetical protein